MLKITLSRSWYSSVLDAVECEWLTGGIVITDAEGEVWHLRNHEFTSVVEVDDEQAQH